MAGNRLDHASGETEEPPRFACINPLQVEYGLNPVHFPNRALQDSIDSLPHVRAEQISPLTVNGSSDFIDGNAGGIEHIHGDTPNKEPSHTLDADRSSGRLKGNYTCDFCRESFSRPYSLERHKETVHGDHPRFRCDEWECNQSYRTKGQLVRHLTQRHQTPMVDCPRCGSRVRPLGLTEHFATPACQQRSEALMFSRRDIAGTTAEGATEISNPLSTPFLENVTNGDTENVNGRPEWLSSERSYGNVLSPPNLNVSHMILGGSKPTISEHRHEQPTLRPTGHRPSVADPQHASDHFEKAKKDDISDAPVACNATELIESLESSERERLLKTQMKRKRIRSGCLTCRKRRLKCGEERPACRNCIKSKRECEGYNQRVVFKPLTFDDQSTQHVDQHTGYQRGIVSNGSTYLQASTAAHSPRRYQAQDSRAHLQHKLNGNINTTNNIIAPTPEPVHPNREQAVRDLERHLEWYQQNFAGSPPQSPLMQANTSPDAIRRVSNAIIHTFEPQSRHQQSIGAMPEIVHQEGTQQSSLPLQSASLYREQPGDYGQKPGQPIVHDQLASEKERFPATANNASTRSYECQTDTSRILLNSDGSWMYYTKGEGRAWARAPATPTTGVSNRIYFCHDGSSIELSRNGSINYDNGMGTRRASYFDWAVDAAGNGWYARGPGSLPVSIPDQYWLEYKRHPEPAHQDNRTAPNLTDVDLNPPPTSKKEPPAGSTPILDQDMTPDTRPNELSDFDTMEYGEPAGTRDGINPDHYLESLLSSLDMANMIESAHHKMLILDSRPSTEYAKSHIKGALNLCIPITLLKRPTFGVERLAETFSREDQRWKFEKWRSRTTIVVYDASSCDRAQVCVSIVKKFRREGFEGALCVLEGGLDEFAQRFPSHVEDGVDAAGRGKDSLGPDLDDNDARDYTSINSPSGNVPERNIYLGRDEDDHTTAPAFTDSGYRSLDRKAEDDAGEETANFSDTDSVRSDNRDSGLTPDVKKRLASEFAREIMDSISLPSNETVEATAQIVSSLPDLLQQYAIIAHENALPGIQQRAAVFVRHQRKLITRSLKSELLCKPDKSNDPSSGDRIELLWNENRNVYVSEIPDDDQDEPPELDDDPIIPEFAEVRQYLVESPEYLWLTNRIMSSSRVMSTGFADTTIRRLAIDLLSGAKEVRLELVWSPTEFFRDQYDGSADLGQVLCYSGLADQAFITTCSDYVKRIWPSFGNEIVDIVTRAARLASNRFSAVLSDNTSVIVELNGYATIVIAKGRTTTLIELIEVLAWLGASCRASSNEQTAYCIPRLIGGRSLTDPVKTCQVSYDLESIEQPVTDDSGRCWQALSRNPVIAQCYPIPMRTNNEIGAEMSIGAMARLGCTPWATRFMETLVLKGFCTMFLPILTVGRSIVWHFLIDNDQKRISYNNGLSVQSSVGFIDYSNIETSRHFVGWVPSAKILAGTKGACYNVSRSAGELSTAGTGALSEVSLGFSKLLSLDATFVRGKKDTPLALLDHRPYEWQVIAASEMNVLFYDTESKTSWLLDGATGLLHLSRAWLSSKFAMTVPKSAIESFQHASSFDGRESAIKALLCQDNRELPLYKASERTSEITIDPATKMPVKVDKIKESWFCWENLVQSKWNIIEQIHDHVVRLRTSGPSDLPRLKTLLEGFEFVDILTEPTQIRPRMIDIQSTAGDWIEFVAQNEAVNIFGSGFGDLILPGAPEDRRHSNCSQHEGVPKGRDYLAAPVYILNDIISRHRRPDALWLGRSIYWADSDKCFRKCPCSGPSQRNRCLPASAKLHCSQNFWRKCPAPHLDFLNQYLSGAILFGEKSNIIQNCLSKRPLDTGDVFNRNTRPRPSDSGVDFLSSHSSYSSGTWREIPRGDRNLFIAT